MDLPLSGLPWLAEVLVVVPDEPAPEEVVSPWEEAGLCGVCTKRTKTIKPKTTLNMRILRFPSHSD